MKLSEIKRDPVAIEQGQWVGAKYGTPIPDMGDLNLKMRGIGNADWRRVQDRLLQAVPRNKRIGGSIDPDERDKITNICLQSAGLIDWDGVQDEQGKPLAYDKSLAGDLLTKPEYRAFRDATLWAATVVGEQIKSDLETDAKN